MKIDLLRSGTLAVVSFSGPLTASEVDSFRDELMSWFKDADQIRDIVMDLGEVDFLDSSGLGALLVCLKRVAERGGDLKIARLQKKVRMIFEITRTYRIFEIFDTVEEAVRAFA